MEQIGLYVSVPIACFRVPRAREYFESFPCPPPATIYGMLLSVVGEVRRRVHEGAEIAVATLSEPEYSTVLRTLWRVKDKGEGLGLGNNRRPDFQELLADVRLGVWVRRGANEANEVSLAQRLQIAIDEPSSISRFGGLSLGESTHMVDEVLEFKAQRNHGKVLVAATDGDLTLPIWVDHVGSKTNWQQYKLVDTDLTGSLPDGAWTTISRPNY